MSEHHPAFRPDAFFDLGPFRHRALFADGAPVWEALAAIGDYIRALPRPAGGGTVSPGAWIEGTHVYIDDGAVVEAGAYIRGPCYIGRGSAVRHGAYLRGDVLVGDDCVVGHATEAKSSIFLDGAKAGHFAYVGNSILGHGVNLGAGTKLANLRLDGKPIAVLIGRSRIETGTRKLGAVLGDGTETGCNSVTNPGTFLGRQSVVYACASVLGYHGERSRIGARPLQAPLENRNGDQT